MQPKIESYDFGSIVIEGVEFNRDVIISPSRGVISNWWRREGHRICIEDIKDFLYENVDAVVIGTGYYGMVEVDKDVIDFYRSRGIEVVATDSRNAVRIYN